MNQPPLGRFFFFFFLHGILLVQRARFWNLKLFEEQRSQLGFGGINYSGKIKFYQPSKLPLPSPDIRSFS